MGRNSKNNKQQRMKKQNEKLLTALTATAASTSTSASTSTPTSTQASAASAATTAVDANDNDNDNRTTETTTTITCFHGSDERNFAKASDYQIVFDEFIFILDKQGTAEYESLYYQFETKYENLLKDSDVYKYIFAYTTDMFRNSYRTEKYSSSFKWKLRRILQLGINSKYG